MLFVASQSRQELKARCIEVKAPRWALRARLPIVLHAKAADQPPQLPLIARKYAPPAAAPAHQIRLLPGL
jgi:hypothetical protein